MKTWILGAWLAIGLTACRSSEDTSGVFVPLENPTGAGAGEPNLFYAPNGQFYLSWLEPVNDTLWALRFAARQGNGWSTPRTVATGHDWFVNWADFPSLVANQQGILAAHWLAKSDSGAYDYDVTLSVSNDQGNTWSAPFLAHRDGVSAEHGFVSLVPLPDGTFFATWLDGRNMVGGHEGHEGHGHGHGSMTLRGARFDAQGGLTDEAQLDALTCECCQTDAALTDNGLVVVYRNRTEQEVRDVYVVRQVDGEWTEPRPVFEDGWEIAGCPVNGPALAAKGKQLAVAWFTGKDQPTVKVAFSEDAGASFGPPTVLDADSPLGRLDVVWHHDRAWVSWLDAEGDSAAVRVAQISPEGGKLAEQTVATVARSRSSGFPILENANGQLYLAYTEPGEPSHIRMVVWEAAKNP